MLGTCTPNNSSTGPNTCHLEGWQIAAMQPMESIRMRDVGFGSTAVYPTESRCTLRREVVFDSSCSDLNIKAVKLMSSAAEPLKAVPAAVSGPRNPISCR